MVEPCRVEVLLTGDKAELVRTVKQHRPNWSLEQCLGWLLECGRQTVSLLPLTSQIEEDMSGCAEGVDIRDTNLGKTQFNLGDHVLIDTGDDYPLMAGEIIGFDLLDDLYSVKLTPASRERLKAKNFRDRSVFSAWPKDLQLM